MDCWDTRGYPQPRFASEYGLQSMPDFHTLSTVTEEGDWSFFSPLMIHRQHHGGGKVQLPCLIICTDDVREKKFKIVFKIETVQTSF